MLDHPERFETLTVDAPGCRRGGWGREFSAEHQVQQPYNPAPTDRAAGRTSTGPTGGRPSPSTSGRGTILALQEHLTLRPYLSSIDLPTLITRGDIDDDVHPLSHAIEWHAARPSSWLWIAAGTAFSAAQNQAAAFARVFSAFVEHSAAEKST